MYPSILIFRFPSSKNPFYSFWYIPSNPDTFFLSEADFSPALPPPQSPRERNRLSMISGRWRIWCRRMLRRTKGRKPIPSNSGGSWEVERKKKQVHGETQCRAFSLAKVLEGGDRRVDVKSRAIAHFPSESVGEAISQVVLTTYWDRQTVDLSLALPSHPQFLYGMDGIPESPECPKGYSEMSAFS